MVHYSNKCLKKQNKTKKKLFTNVVPGWIRLFSCSWSVCVLFLLCSHPPWCCNRSCGNHDRYAKHPADPPAPPHPHPTTCCSFGNACFCLCLLIGGLLRSVRLFIFTWMARYRAIFLSGAAEQPCIRNTAPLFLFLSLKSTARHM